MFTLTVDPVGAGFVASLARPGGNVTGFTGYEYGLGTKWLELLKEIAPELADTLGYANHRRMAAHFPLWSHFGRDCESLDMSRARTSHSNPWNWLIMQRLPRPWANWFGARSTSSLMLAKR